MKVKDEIVDDADVDDYDEAREEGELEDEGDGAENDAAYDVMGRGKMRDGLQITDNTLESG